MDSIDQAEFRELFAQEAAMRLARLGELLLELEQNPGDEEVVRSIFREVHTIKGAAAVVGFDDVSRVAHVLEERLDDLRTGRCPVTPGLIDALLMAVDGLTVLTGRAAAGDEHGPEAAALEAQLRVALDVSADRGASGSGQEQPAAEPEPRPGRDGEPGKAEGPSPEPVEVIQPSVAPAPDFGPGNAGASGPRPVALASKVTAGGASPIDIVSEARARHTTRDGAVVMVPLQRLDETIRLVGESAAAHLRVGRVFSERLDLEPASIPEFGDLSAMLNDLQEQTMRVRMVPVATITDHLHRAVRDLARSLRKDVAWEVRGGDTELDRGILQQLADSLLHLVRNAVDHGIESVQDRLAAGKPAQATVRLHAMQLGSEVIIAVTDDGRGIDLDRVRSSAAGQGVDLSTLSEEDVLEMIFRPGLSTARFVSDISGRGVGLDVVRDSVAAVRGRIAVRNDPGSGTEFRIIVPVTLAVLPCLLVLAGGQRFALPLHSVDSVHGAATEVGAHAEGKPAIWVDGHPVAVSELAHTLGLAANESGGPIVVVAGASRRQAFRVDCFVGRRDVVVKGLNRMLPQLSVLSGASVEPDGEILLILDPPGLIERARRTRLLAPTPLTVADDGSMAMASVLVVDDALTVRELQRTILERAGYRVRVASDGVEAMALLAQEISDLVLTDVEMPRMDGFGLTEAIRATAGTANTPILILTSRSSDIDRQRGLEAGADGYIVKSAFDERALLTAVERLLGARA